MTKHRTSKIPIIGSDDSHRTPRKRFADAEAQNQEPRCVSPCFPHLCKSRKGGPPAEWIKQLVAFLWLQLFIVEFFFRLVAELLRIVTKMKMIYKLALFLLVLLAVGGCMALYNMFFDVILESKDVQNFKVQEVQGTHPTWLQLSGLAFNSSMGVRKISTKRDGTAVVVLVHLSLAHRAASGNFAYELTVPDSVNEVRFGHSVTPVWKRATRSSEVPSSPSAH